MASTKKNHDYNDTVFAGKDEQLKKVVSIVEALTEGRKDDSGYSGYQDF